MEITGAKATYELQRITMPNYSWEEAEVDFASMPELDQELTFWTHKLMFPEQYGGTALNNNEKLALFIAFVSGEKQQEFLRERESK